MPGVDVEFVEDGVPCLTQRTLVRLSPWALLVGCAMLNQTHRRQARPALVEVFRMGGTPEEFLGVPDAPLRAALLSCGLADRRMQGLRQMTAAWLRGVPPRRLPHTGPYAWDSYDIFVRGVVLHPDDVGDHSLKPYLEGVWEGRWPPPEPPTHGR
jgi:hypothetical protein